MIVVRFYAHRLAALAVVAFLIGSATLSHAGFTEFTVGGSTVPSSIQPTIDAFRTAIGGANNGNAAGPIASGRREINWDGGGAATATVSGPILTTFTDTRGATLSIPGNDGFGSFLQTPLNAPELTNIQASYATTFSVFSAQRVFTPLGINLTDVTFFIPGTGGATPATVAAFGAVFSDVDFAGNTWMEFFNAANESMFILNVPPGLVGAAPNGTFSFAGAIATEGLRIAKVRINSGNVALVGPEPGPFPTPADVVVMDDFIYAEPLAVPEPASAALATAGALLLASVSRRKRSS